MLGSSRSLIFYRACFLWTLGFYLIKDPVSVFRNALVVVLGAGTDLHQTYAKDVGSFVPFTAALFVMLGAQDLGFFFMKDPLPALGPIVTFRLLTYFCLSIMSYLSLFGLGYSVIFSYVFLELIMNFWIYMKVREETNESSRIEIREKRGHTSHD